jgi:DNA-binding transcriptional MerR regulator
MGGSGEQGGPTGLVWTAGAVARRLGIAPATLRSWNRRYQLGPATHQRGRHRRYTDQDVAVLETMCRLIAEGVVPAAAARIALSSCSADPARPAGRHGTDQREVDGREADGPGAVDGRGGGSGRPGVGGQVVRGLVQAALRLDAETLAGALDHQLATRGLERTWDEVCVPALTALGRRVTPDGDCVDAVHLLSWVITAGLHRHTPAVPSTHRSRVLLACADGERHSLGLEALHAVLAGHGIAARMLGPSVPARALDAAAKRIRPAVVVVWAQVSRTARIGGLRPLVDTVGRVVAAGPGWRLSRLPAGVVRVDGLAEATGCIRDVVRVDRVTADVTAPGEPP